MVFTEDTSPITNDDAVLIFSGDARTTVSGGSAGKCTFDACLFEIAGCQPRIRMNTGHAHKEQICMNILYAFDGRRADRNNRVFIQPSADQNHLNGRMINKPQSNTGLCVTTVMRKSGGKKVISSEVVVPPSIITTWPDNQLCPFPPPFFASIFTDCRSANGAIAEDDGSAPP